MSNARDTYVGTDTTGAEYWLVPNTDDRGHYMRGGHRVFEIRKSRKHVPRELAGLWTDTGQAIKAFELWMSPKPRAKASSPEDTEE